MEAQLAFARMAHDIAMNLIVFTNEMWVEFNSIQRGFNGSRTCGSDPNELTIHNKEVFTTRVMFWGVIHIGQGG